MKSWSVRPGEKVTLSRVFPYPGHGEIAYRLSLPAGFDLRDVRRDLLYGVARTGNGTPVVHVYRLIRTR